MTSTLRIAKTLCRLAGLLSLSAVLLLTPRVNYAFAAIQDEEPVVRVRLFESSRPESIVVGSESGLSFFAGEYDSPIGRALPGERVAVSLRRGEVLVTLEGAEIQAQLLRALPDGEQGFFVEATENGRSERRTYSGGLTVKADPNAQSRLLIVNHVPLEEYVAGVIPNEYPFNDTEGTKAMAVVVRTYAVKSAGKFGPDYDHVDGIRSQVYKGTQGVTPHIRNAVEATAGQILTYNGSLIEAVHFASSGGHTANNETVWQSQPLPYLRGKADPYDTDPQSGWTSRVNRAELLRFLSRTYGDTVEGVLFEKRAADGRIEYVTLLYASGKRRDVPSNEFRLKVNGQFGVNTIKSTLFSARRAGEIYVFEGRGRGHGVGLSQTGAHEMAVQGYSYREILTFYFTGVSIVNLSGRRFLLTGNQPVTEPDIPVRETSYEPETIVPEMDSVTVNRLPKREPPPAERTRRVTRLPEPKGATEPRRIGW